MHHVAWHVRNQQELTTWQKHLQSNSRQTSGEVDQHYFKSHYFHITSGILFEIATDGPGFAADGEDPEHLGKKLALHPFLEPCCTSIEANIKPLVCRPTIPPSS